MAIDQRFVRSELTRLRLKETSSYSKNLTFKDVYTTKVVFRTGNDWQLEKLLDADKKPIVNVVTKENIKNIYYVHRSNATATEGEEKKDAALMQIYVKQGLIAKTGYLDTSLRVDFTDVTTGERCKVEIQRSDALAALYSGSSVAPTALAQPWARSTVRRKSCAMDSTWISRRMSTRRSCY